MDFEERVKGETKQKLKGEIMEQATLDYYEPIFLEVVKRNPDKFVEIIRPFVERKKSSRWLTTEELCEELGTSTSSWLKSDVRNHQDERIHDHINIKRNTLKPYRKFGMNGRIEKDG